LIGAFHALLATRQSRAIGGAALAALHACALSGVLVGGPQSALHTTCLSLLRLICAHRTRIAFDCAVVRREATERAQLAFSCTDTANELAALARLTVRRTERLDKRAARTGEARQQSRLVGEGARSARSAGGHARQWTGTTHRAVRARQRTQPAAELACWTGRALRRAIQRCKLSDCTLCACGRACRRAPSRRTKQACFEPLEVGIRARWAGIAGGGTPSLRKSTRQTQRNRWVSVRFRRHGLQQAHPVQFIACMSTDHI
jgi:hypothetical protein